MFVGKDIAMEYQSEDVVAEGNERGRVNKGNI